MGPVGPLLVINGPHVVIVLYWAPYGSCYYMSYWLYFGQNFPYKGESIQFLLNYESW